LLLLGLTSCEKDYQFAPTEAVRDVWEELIYGAIPSAFQLSATPNPFSDSLSIMYTVPSSSSLHPLRLIVLDRSQNEIITLVDSSQHQAGTFNIIWNGISKANNQTPSGFYYIELKGWLTSCPVIRRLIVFRRGN